MNAFNTILIIIITLLIKRTEGYLNCVKQVGSSFVVACGSDWVWVLAKFFS